MVNITYNQKKIIARELPAVHIRRTVKQKSKRHRYYMEENPTALRLLRILQDAEASASKEYVWRGKKSKVIS